MSQAFSADLALEALRNVESGAMSPADAMEAIVRVISRNLDQFQVTKNSQNAAQVVRLLLAELFPEYPLSRFILNGVNAGRLPDFSTEPPHEHSLYRACAVFACTIHQYISSNDAPQAGAKQVDDLIANLGYLPSEVIE